MSTWAEQRRADRQVDREENRKDRAHTFTLRQQNLDQAEARSEKKKIKRREDRKRFWGRLPTLGMSAMWATMIVLPITLAWNAQAKFAAEDLDIERPWNHAFPAVIELGAWLCAFEAHHRKGEAVGALRRWMWVLAGIAAVIQFSHSEKTSSGIALGSVSLLGVLLHHIRHSLDEQKHAGRTAEQVRLAAFRRVRYPWLSLAARRFGQLVGGCRHGVDAAWEGRYGVGPDVPRWERKVAKEIKRREVREGKKAAKDGQITIVGGRVQRAFAPEVTAFVDAERQAAMDQIDHAVASAEQIVQGAADALNAAGMLFGPDAFGVFAEHGKITEQASEQATDLGEHGERSIRAAALLPHLQEAIRAEQVPPNPTVRTIIEWVRTERNETCGAPTAQELKRAVQRLHAVDGDREGAA